MCVEKKWSKFSDNMCLLFLSNLQRTFFFWPFAHHLWRNIRSGPSPLFKSGICFVVVAVTVVKL